jgi:glycosyltransferase involved in cell wall biosynthesis
MTLPANAHESRLAARTLDLPPRVLMVLKRSAGRGGMQQQARRVAARLRFHGVPVSLVSHSTQPVRVKPGWSRVVPTHYLLAPDQWRFAAALLQHLLRYRQAYDVVHVHGFGLETFAAMTARRITGKPLVVKPSTAGPGTKLDRYARFSRAMPGAGGIWRSVDAWISISEQTTTDLRRMRIPNGRIAFVPNGVDTDRYRPLPPDARAALRRELGLAPDEALLVTACRLAPHKRADLLIRAFLGLRDEFPRARLWVLGEGEQRSELQGLLDTAPGGERVKLWGYVKAGTLRRHLQAADVFALLSLWEGLSNALLEAMACGLPPVVSAVSGMVDVIQPGVTGLAVPPDDEPAARSALRELLLQPDRRVAMGAAAARSARKEYGIDQTTERLRAVYRACLTGEPLPNW